MTSEAVAMWVEAIALVAIFGLDWFERRDQRKERREQHKEMAVQLDSAKRAADAASQSAEAAKLSADVVAALHRPLIGLESLPTVTLASNTIWEFPSKLRNYGTLPASRLNATFDFYTESAHESRYPLKTVEGPESVEIFPNAAYEIALQPTPTAEQVNQISSQSKKLILTVKATYVALDDRKFE